MRINNTSFLRDNRATICIVSAEIDGNVRDYVGVAIKHRVDSNNTQLARDLAEARAIAKISKKMTRRAEGLVRQQDQIYAAKQARQTAVPRQRRTSQAATLTATANA